MTNSVTVSRGGISLVCIIVAIVAFLLAAFGVGSKLGIDIVDLGLAFFVAAFIFG